MAEFMKPKIESQTMVLVEDKYGESRWVYPDTLPDEGTVVEAGKGWFAQFSAPGYMDQTEWQGPYKSWHSGLYALYADYDRADMWWADFLRKYDMYSVELARAASWLEPQWRNGEEMGVTIDLLPGITIGQ